MFLGRDRNPKLHCSKHEMLAKQHLHHTSVGAFTIAVTSIVSKYRSSNELFTKGFNLRVSTVKYYPYKRHVVFSTQGTTEFLSLQQETVLCSKSYVSFPKHLSQLLSIIILSQTSVLPWGLLVHATSCSDQFLLQFLTVPNGTFHPHPPIVAVYCLVKTVPVEHSPSHLLFSVGVSYNCMPQLLLWASCISDDHTKPLHYHLLCTCSLIPSLGQDMP